ncbi:MAG: dihydropteroate synthase [Deltaproteobacteria bacterium]|nr:dihydropteroate synthase [Deltaproteobacteria bacterium]
MSRFTTPLLSSLAGLSVGDSLPVRVMAILNVSPESFYKGSVQTSRESLAEAAQAMVNAGADIIDIGAMSTAPYLKTHISIEEETDRLTQAVEAVAQYVSTPISADTQRAQPAAAALAAGARIINDVSGLKQDPALATVIAKAGAGAILMATEVTPGTGPPMVRIREALQESLQIAAHAGIPRHRLVLDPGIGFFRKPGMPWDEWDCTVLRELVSLRALDSPLLVGVSRKSFIGKILGQSEAADRLLGSLACAAVAVYNGAHLIRAHDVKETVETVRMAERLRPVFSQ